MPKLGLTMTEGVVTSWQVGPGDQVRSGDVLFVVETEKIATEIEAEGDGRIETIEVPEGATVAVGAVVATWTSGRSVRPQQGDDRVTAASRPDARATARMVATPLARRLARQAGIPLHAAKGTGPRGRIKAHDIEVLAAASTAANASDKPRERATEGTHRRAASMLEKVVARRMTEAKQTIPHFYLLAEADVTRLVAFREEANSMPEFARLSINHLVIATVGRAIVRMPEMNIVWDDGEFVQLSSSDIGMAVSTDRGLYAPVVRDAGRLPLETLSRTADEVTARARAGQLLPDELTGGAIAVSNVGMYGASHLVPIINPGQSALLGVGRIKEVFRPDAGGKPELRREIGLVLSCDHRVFDGVAAARFLNCITGLLEKPIALLRM